MSPNWKGVLETFHSCLIDELLHRFPNSRPTLGMPIKFDAWQLENTAKFATLCDISHAGSRGIAAVSFNDQAYHSVGGGSSEHPHVFWNACVHRCALELSRRQLKVTLSVPLQYKAGDAYPKNLIQPTRLIWIPIGIENQSFHLGIGI
ncbi:MAG: hypothetical protein H7222_11445 [Methylotenera sp.]|nr:hypothetical protein [Oligoflexia bacterium]